MISALATGSLNTINHSKISALTNAGDGFSGSSSDESTSEFPALFGDLLASSGNHQPLELTDIAKLDGQQLSDLAKHLGLELPANSISIQQLQLNIYNAQANAVDENKSILANPEANALFKTRLISSGSVDEELLAKKINAADLITKTLIDDEIQQPGIKKGADLSLALIGGDAESSEYMKKFMLDEVDLSSHILSTPTRQESSSARLVDSLNNIDKIGNVTHSFSNPQMQSHSSQESTVLTLRQIEVPVQKAAWGEAVGNRLMMMVNDKVQTAQIHLNPPELGPIEVRVNLNHDQASVHFVSNNSIVRDAIDDAFPRLKEMFMQNGLTLNDANVSQQSSQQSNTNTREEHDATQLLSNEAQDLSDAEHDTNLVTNIGLIDQYV